MWDRAGRPGKPGALPAERLAREDGTIVKDWGGRVPVALVYPNSYYLGMSNLGIHAVYGLLNSQSDVLCERVFWEKGALGKPLLALESQRPLNDFAAIAFSLSYELDYFNVVQVLRAGGLPLYAAERDERHPLVIAGGACVTANPMPLSPFFDCLCIGEAEPILADMLPVLRQGIGGSRRELLETLALLPGVFVPSHYGGKPVVRQWARDLDKYPVGSVVLTRDTELGDLFLMEVERGCGRGCRFCMVCNTFSPVRFRSVESLLGQARGALPRRKRLGLVGPTVSDHPRIEELLAGLRGLGAQLSFSSLRIGSLSPRLWEEIAAGGVRTVTLAPEAGSQRLRDVIKKGITGQQILESIRTAAEKRMNQLKLYFMIGLPTETDEDIEALAALVLDAKDIIDRTGSGTRLTLNIGALVPKAGTPFQWLAMAPLDTLDRRMDVIRKRLAAKGIKPNCESPAWSEVQAALSRGDAGIAGLLAGMREWSLPAWRRAIAESGLDMEALVHREWHTSQLLPWVVVDAGTNAERLKAELERALGRDRNG